jgi:fluoride exporter
VTPATWVPFMIAAAAGAIARYTLDTLISHRVQGAFPWGTFVINVCGSLTLGVVTGLALYHGLGSRPRIVLGTGFCGAFTTFSTFTFETIRLAEERATTDAALNLGGTLIAAAAAAALGLALTAI